MFSLIANTEFEPYNFDQGGNAVGIAGEDFALIAGCTRLSDGFKVLSRQTTRLFPVTKTCVLGAVGCWADVKGFIGMLDARTKLYELEQWKPIKPPSVAQLMATMLYNRRLFPYYVYSVMGAVDDNGAGLLYGFNPFGLAPPAAYFAVGTGTEIIEPFLDSQLGDGAFDTSDEPTFRTDWSLEDAMKLVRDVFVVAAERDIFTGDGLRVAIITAAGVDEKYYELRRD